MGLKNKILTTTIALGLVSLVSLNNAKSTSIKSEENLIKNTLSKFAQCVEAENSCAADFFIDWETHQKINCQDDNEGDYPSSAPWADVTHETFKIIPKNINILPYNKNGVSNVVYVNSTVKTRCECTYASCAGLTFGKLISDFVDCPRGSKEHTMKNYTLTVEYKLFKLDNGKYYIDDSY